MQKVKAFYMCKRWCRGRKLWLSMQSAKML